MSVSSDLAEKRARLVAATDLERMKLRLAWHDIRVSIAPAPDADRRSRVRPYVLRAIGFALPVVGYRRMGRALRTAAAALAVWRAATAWRSFRGR